MRAVLIIVVVLGAVLPAHTAPTTKPGESVASEIGDELKRFQSRLSSLNDEFAKILEAIHKEPGKESEKREIYNTERYKKEDDPFISRVAQTVASKLSLNDPPAIIERLVNSTANSLVEKMNASHGHVNEFKLKLSAAVIQILNERSEKQEQPSNKTQAAGPAGVNEAKVVQAIEELLEGPLISGFVSQEQEKVMIRSAVEALSKDFGISRSTAEDGIRAMTEHIHQDVKTRSNQTKETAKPMTDEEKILGLEKMVDDKVKENHLNINEMKYLVKALAAAVGARNKLSKESTKHLEEKIWKGAKEYFEKNKISETKSSDITHSSLLDNKNVPEGFRQAQEADENKDKRSFEVEEDDEDDSQENLFAQLRELERKWHEKSKISNADQKSLEEAEKQKQYLKEILSNSIALIESLDVEQKEHKELPKKPTEPPKKHTNLPTKQTELPPTKPSESAEKQTTLPTKPSESPKKSTEPPKTHTNLPTKPTELPKKHTTESHTTTTHTEQPEKTTVNTKAEKQHKKNDVISDDMEEEIEKAEAEIQQELEKQQIEDQNKMSELEKKKEKEKPKEKTQQHEEQKISQEEIEQAEKKIAKELEEQANSLELKSKVTTTAKPQTTKKKEANNELIKQLDDLFQEQN